MSTPQSRTPNLPMQNLSTEIRSNAIKPHLRRGDNPRESIRSLQDVRWFLTKLIVADELSQSFHPENDFTEYIDYSLALPTQVYNSIETSILQDMMSSAFEVCACQSGDPDVMFKIAMEVWYYAGVTADNMVLQLDTEEEVAAQVKVLTDLNAPQPVHASLISDFANSEFSASMAQGGHEQRVDLVYSQEVNFASVWVSANDVRPDEEWGVIIRRALEEKKLGDVPTSAVTVRGTSIYR